MVYQAAMYRLGCGGSYKMVGLGEKEGRSIRRLERNKD